MTIRRDVVSPETAVGLLTAHYTTIAQELSGIRAGVSDVRAEIAALGQDLKAVRTEQERQDGRLSRIEADLNPLRTSQIKVEDLDRRLSATETDVEGLKLWRTEEKVKWSGPQKAIAVIASLVPLAAAAYAVVQWVASLGS